MENFRENPLKEDSWADLDLSLGQKIDDCLARLQFKAENAMDSAKLQLWREKSFSASVRFDGPGLDQKTKRWFLTLYEVIGEDAKDLGLISSYVFLNVGWNIIKDSRSAPRRMLNFASKAII